MTNKELVYLSAVRYALGRRSYIVRSVVDFLASQDLSQTLKDAIIKEIDTCKDLGEDVDKRDWVFLKEELL